MNFFTSIYKQNLNADFVPRCLVALSVASYLLSDAINTINTSNTSVSFQDLSFGAVSPSTMLSILTKVSLDVTSSEFSVLFAVVLLCNTPQIVFSVLYYMYNRLYTSMVSAQEWSHFAYERKYLRVLVSGGQPEVYILAASSLQI